MSDSTTINGLEDSENAIRHKELGNQDFKNGHYDKAISHYTRAIGNTLSLSGDSVNTCDVESHSVDKRTVAICLTNRAQCHIRVEEFGLFSPTHRAYKCRNGY